jgi:hypothetical protein
VANTTKQEWLVILNCGGTYILNLKLWRGYSAVLDENKKLLQMFDSISQVKNFSAENSYDLQIYERLSIFFGRTR